MLDAGSAWKSRGGMLGVASSARSRGADGTAGSPPANSRTDRAFPRTAHPAWPQTGPKSGSERATVSPWGLRRLPAPARPEAGAARCAASGNTVESGHESGRARGGQYSSITGAAVYLTKIRQKQTLTEI